MADDFASPSWHPFAYHSLDVAAVATTFWRASPRIPRAFASAFEIAPDELDRLCAWILFFITLHDIGKLHTLFQIKSLEASALAWPELDPREVMTRKAHGYDHGVEGFRLVKQDLPLWHAQEGSAAKRWWRRWRPWIAAVTGHHGDIPGENEESPPPRGYAEAHLIEQDTEARRSWVAQAEQLFLSPAGLALSDLPPECGVAAAHLLAGFCSVCDWIGSNAEHFHYTEPTIGEAAYFKRCVEQITAGQLFRDLGMVVSAKSYQGLDALLRPGEQPRGIQVVVDTLPLAPGLTLIEAPTGVGKTEAALAYAWRLVEAGLAEGIVFALPTQATANAMLTRAADFGGHAFGHANVVLAHGNRSLNEEFRRLIDAGRRITAQGVEEAGRQCATWLASSRKRVFLGQIGVCTVDQVLLSVLPVRHRFVRGFGLARAVLIIDEVHAYDAYMNGLLTEVLRRQRASGGSAILLSATLPAAIRQDLLSAWEAPTDDRPEQAPYPVLWCARNQGIIQQTVPDQHRPPQRLVSVETLKLPDVFPDETLIRRILDAADAGALIGVVMNTVDQAQRLYARLREATMRPVDLFHARYRLQDRQTIERRVLSCYGRDAERSGGRILVATQVIEQSLDLDFDWLITQLCPVDLLFQRVGRLHRHDRPRPVGFEKAFCTVLCPEQENYAVHELIYNDARLLWRTERLLMEHGCIDFPSAYRVWIEQVYGSQEWDDEPTPVLDSHYTWIQEKRAAKANAEQRIHDTVQQFKDDDSSTTGLTRDGEMSLSLLPTLEDGRLLDQTDWSDLDDFGRAEALMSSTVPVPCSWKSALRQYARDEDGRIRLPLRPTAEGWASLDGYFSYSTRIGLQRVSTADPDDPPSHQPR